MPRKKQDTNPPDEPDYSGGPSSDGELEAARRERWPEDPRLKSPPPEYVAGRRNPESFKHKYACLSATAHAVSMGWEKMPQGLNLSQALDVLNSEARHNGFDPKHLQDARTEGDKMQDAVNRLIESPEAIFEVPDAELELLEQESEKAVALCEKEIQRRRDLNGADTIEAEHERERRRYEKGKVWLNRLRRVRGLREWVRTTRVPANQSFRRIAAFDAAKPLLYMLYVTRSSMSMDLRGGRHADIKVHTIGYPHAHMVVSIWEARKGIIYDPVKGLVRGDPFGGTIAAYPPGHGKTSIVMAYAGLEACINPMMQGAYLHAKEDKAKENLAYIASMFDLDNAMGRRRDALFPGRVKADYDNNSSKMRLVSKNPTKSPTLIAAGVKNAGLGGDTNIQFWDDVVPQSDRDQPTERDRRSQVLSFTWKTRNRGKNTFILFTGYPWHNDDVMVRHITMIRERKLNWVYSHLPVGGPNTTPRFASIWPEVYPPEVLRAKFDETNRDHALWSANYMLNPISDEMRLIRKVRLYDQTADEHVEFMRSARFHVTVDPTATNKEESDKAGIVYGGVGEVLSEHGGETFYQNRFRLLDWTALHVNQVEVADHVAHYAAIRPVYQVHVETRSGFHATADILRDKYDLEVVRHDPGPKGKVIRLKACAGVIDDSAADFRALVEFPGLPDGRGGLVPDPKFVPLIKQFIDFGVNPEDHCVDATTQLINYLLREGDLEPGTDEATRTVRTALAEKGDPRMLAILKEYEAGPKRRDVDKEDWTWFANRN